MEKDPGRVISLIKITKTEYPKNLQDPNAQSDTKEQNSRLLDLNGLKDELLHRTCS